MMKIIASCSPAHLFKWCFDGGLSIMLWWRLHIEISQLVKIHQNDQDMRRHFLIFITTWVLPLCLNLFNTLCAPNCTFSTVKGQEKGTCFLDKLENHPCFCSYSPFTTSVACNIFIYSVCLQQKQICKTLWRTLWCQTKKMLNGCGGICLPTVQYHWFEYMMIWAGLAFLTLTLM